MGDARFTEVVTVRRWADGPGGKPIFLNPNPNVPGLRVEAKLRDGSTQTRYYLDYSLNVQPGTEITAADGSVWVVTKYIDHTSINLKDGKGPLYAAVMLVEKKPAPAKK